MDPPASSSTRKGRAFWLSFVALLTSVFLSALDLTAVGTALPTITAQLNGGSEFVWVGAAYALSSTAFLPLSGKLADIFGRRSIMLLCIVFFALGSALAGAAQNMPMMIAARTIQGIGGGGIINMTDIITSDLVPLAERGVYIGIVALAWAFASAIGPPIGGALAQSSWRWLFFLNLPLCAIAFVLVLVFLRVRTPPGSLKEKLSRVDWIGNAIIIVGTTLSNIGLTWGGIQFPWSSAAVLVCLIVGFVLIGLFLLYEFKVPREPTVPYDILANRTSLSAILSTTIHGIVSISAIYYLPVYFQASFAATPIRSGVDLLGTALVITPFALAAGILTQVLNRYIPANVLGWVITIIGFGVLSLLKADSSVGRWVGFQVVAATGLGLLWVATIFPVLAPLSVERAAAALSLLAFVRAFAQTWGISISGAILQNELKKNLPAEFLSLFPDGVEIAYASIPVIKTLQEPLRSEVREAFATSLSIIWKTMIGISGLGLLTLPFLKEVPMLTHTDETYGLHDGEKTKGLQDESVGEKSVATSISQDIVSSV